MPDSLARSNDKAPWHLVGTTYARSAAATTHSMTPTGKAREGDVVMIGYCGRNATPGDASGGSTFTSLFWKDTDNGEHHRLWWKVAGPTEPTSYDVVSGSGDGYAIVLAVWRPLKAVTMDVPGGSYKQWNRWLPEQWAPKGALYVGFWAVSLDQPEAYPAPPLQLAVVCPNYAGAWATLAWMPVMEDGKVGGVRAKIGGGLGFKSYESNASVVTF